MGLDIAGGEKEGDDSVITVGGCLPDGRWVVIDCKYGKFSMRDNITDDSAAYLRQDRIITDKQYVTKTGYIDEAFRLNLIYKVNLIKVGQGGGSEGAIRNEMERVFRVNYDYTQIFPRVQNNKTGNKMERIMGTLLPKYETRSVFHKEGLDKLEYQLEFLGKSTRDDLADCNEVTFFNMQRPENISYKLFGQPIVENKRKSWIPNRQDQNIMNYDWRIN